MWDLLLGLYVWSFRVSISEFQIRKLDFQKELGHWTLLRKAHKVAWNFSGISRDYPYCLVFPYSEVGKGFVTRAKTRDWQSATSLWTSLFV